jgi:hypothetical protein
MHQSLLAKSYRNFVSPRQLKYNHKFSTKRLSDSNKADLIIKEWNTMTYHEKMSFLHLRQLPESDS